VQKRSITLYFVGGKKNLTHLFFFVCVTDYYFGQPQGRFIPSTYQNSRNNYYDPATQTRNQQPGSFQEQTLFVNPVSGNNGRSPITNQPQHGNQETVKPSYFHFQQFPVSVYLYY
jgi:hypothetical protein